jgi:hypothetical protein
MDTMMMETEDFRVAVMTQLTALAKGQDALNKGQADICSKLDKANGNIGELFDKSAAGVIALKDHIIMCPQKDHIDALRLRLEILDKELAIGEHPGSKEVNKRVAALELYKQGLEATRNENKWWLTLLWPLLSAAGGALLMYWAEATYYAKHVLPPN